MRRRGFTLVELLVVVAIIGLLAAILVPVLGRVQARGRTADCTNNLRQIGEGLALYVNSWRGRYPVAARKPSEKKGPSLRLVMADQVEGEEIWRCPEDETFFASEGLSYEWNSFLSGQVLQASVIYKLAMRNAAAVPLLGDYEKVHDGGSSRVVLFADGHAEVLR